ncbi:MAG: hypothetical protein KF813_09410 [Trueperaceae bacterium]|nr:hypothetical protein [Trueperaceae bacterium]
MGTEAVGVQSGVADNESASPTLGSFVAGLKSGRETLRDRHAFLARSTLKGDGPSLAGMPLVGLGGSCGKPAFLLPFVVRFDDARLERLEATAARFGMFVEYGAYPHLKLEDSGQEIAAVQDWTTATMLFLRPSYAHKEELAEAVVQALA